jgi:hypothetical protein
MAKPYPSGAQRFSAPAVDSCWFLHARTKAQTSRSSGRLLLLDSPPFGSYSRVRRGQGQSWLKAVPALPSMIHEYRSDLTAIEANVLKRAMIEGHEFGFGPTQGAISNACSDGLDESLERAPAKPTCAQIAGPVELNSRFLSQYSAHDHLVFLSR